ncbi:TetR/AcrR family transcriptional regulator [Actinoplanes sp. CA-142083]|uniref:TetR/AcrR family transcriptional regulator n=1 Tax=Actinoplanes sp. CA-142083 TaxID=3239903 RepID=UPI003D912EF3
MASATELLHRNGVGATSLAGIAERAEVPLGNVYYYFRTKDDLVRAVLDAQTAQVAAMVEGFAAIQDPAERLKALASRWDQMRDVVTRYGCPFGSLSTELTRRDDSVGQADATPMRNILEWTTTQFRELGCAEARNLAITLLSAIQGSALLAATLREPEVLTAEIRRLHDWIETVTPGHADRVGNVVPVD